MGIDTEFGVLRISVVARSGAGAISVPGLKVGDIVIWCFQTSPPAWTGPGGAFEAIISVADELQQTGSVGGLQGVPFDLILLRGV